jgi:ubiquinone/menaquinone biosynthesis C-methylase UbiE
MSDYFDLNGNPITRRDIYSELYATRSNYRMGEPRFRRIREQLEKDLPAHVLDVGCGRGEIVQWLREQEIHAVGAEIVPALCKNGVVQIGTVADLPFFDSEFDTVICADVLEHIHTEDTETALDELVRVCSRRLLLNVAWFPAVHLVNVANTHIDLHCNKRGFEEWHDLLAARAHVMGQWTIEGREAFFVCEVDK